jgi:hypothetical protein
MRPIGSASRYRLLLDERMQGVEPQPALTELLAVMAIARHHPQG